MRSVTVLALAMSVFWTTHASAQGALRVHIAANEVLRARVSNQLSDLSVDSVSDAEHADVVVTATPGDTALELDMQDRRWPPGVSEQVDVVPAREGMADSALFETAALRVRAFVRAALARPRPAPATTTAAPPAPPPPPSAPLELVAGLGVRAAIDGSDVPAVGPSVRLGVQTGPFSAALRLVGAVPQSWAITGAEIQRQRFEAVLEGGLDTELEGWRVGGRVWAGVVLELRQTLFGPNPTPSVVHGLLVVGGAPRVGVRWGPVELGLLVGVDVWPARPSYRVAGEQASEPWPVQPHAELTVTLAATP